MVERFSASSIMWSLDGVPLKPEADGTFVRYSDYSELEAENERLRKDRDYWKVEAEGERAKVEYRDRKAAEALSRTGAVKVKALIWASDGTHFQSIPLDHVGYYISPVETGFDLAVSFGGIVVHREGLTSMAAAKAAAQADYERRILSALEPVAPEPQQEAVGGWIVGDGDGTHWRCWENGCSTWTEDREQATRYARREDAEAVHLDDEDAWTIVPYQAEGETVPQIGGKPGDLRAVIASVLHHFGPEGANKVTTDALAARPAPSEPVASPVGVKGLDRAPPDQAKIGWTLPIELLQEIGSETDGWADGTAIEAIEAIALSVERRILSALEPAARDTSPVVSHETGNVEDKPAAPWPVSYANSTAPGRPFETAAPEGQQEAHDFSSDPARSSRCFACGEWYDHPTHSRPSEQAVTEALSRIRDYADKPHADRYVIRNMAENALKAAMEAGRHD